MALARTSVSATVAGTLAVLCALGCGGHSVRHSGTEGSGRMSSGPSGGDGGGSGGGPDEGGAFLAPAGAAFSVSLSAPMTSELPHGTNRTCSAGSTGAFTYAIGQPAPGKTISNGQQEVGVRCAVIPEADGSVTVSAAVNGPDTNLGEMIELEVSGTVDPDPSHASLSHVTFFAPETLRLEVIDDFPLCDLGPFTVLKPGALLADFHCALLGTTDDTSNGCRAAGTLALEYCSTTELP
ncbi:MAG TPA: hypothetical protein VGQ57_21080 [Polyangiaceae bacterium]|nr:hypothetical protein [Polyangiaceae bacterium]